MHSQLRLRNGVVIRFKFALEYNLDCESTLESWKGGENLWLTGRFPHSWRLSLNEASIKPTAKIASGTCRFLVGSNRCCIYTYRWMFPTKASKQFGAANLDQEMHWTLNSSAETLGPGNVKVELIMLIVCKKLFRQEQDVQYIRQLRMVLLLTPDLLHVRTWVQFGWRPWRNKTGDCAPIPPKFPSILSPSWNSPWSKLPSRNLFCFQIFVWLHDFFPLWTLPPVTSQYQWRISHIWFSFPECLFGILLAALYISVSILEANAFRHYF